MDSPKALHRQALGDRALTRSPSAQLMTQSDWILALSIIAGIGTVVGQTMVRKKMWQGWVVSLCNQVLFVYLNLLTGLYGYFIFSAFFIWNACWGIYDWRIKPPPASTRSDPALAGVVYAYHEGLEDES